jgi:hypothetical protein
MASLPESEWHLCPLFMFSLLPASAGGNGSHDGCTDSRSIRSGAKCYLFITVPEKFLQDIQHIRDESRIFFKQGPVNGNCMTPFETGVHPRNHRGNCRSRNAGGAP